MGGPALHVVVPDGRPRERGYDTTLVAGSVSQGEQSMAYVAEQPRRPGRDDPAPPPRDLAGADLLAIFRLARIMRERPTARSCTRTRRRPARSAGVAALLAGGARPPIVVHTFHGHVLRGYFGRLRTWLFRDARAALAHVTDALIAVSPEVRDDLVALGVAPASKFTVIRLGIELDERVAASARRHAPRRAG